MKAITYEQFEQVRESTAEVVPGYSIRKINPHKTVERGVGNCFAKAMIAGAVTKILFDIEPAVAFSDRLHATDRPDSGKPMDPRTNRNMAHISLLAPIVDDRGGVDIYGLCYGINVFNGQKYQQEDRGDIVKYNESEDLVVIENDLILPNETASAYEMVVEPWRQGGQRWLAKLQSYLPEGDERLIDLNFDELITSVSKKI